MGLYHAMTCMILLSIVFSMARSRCHGTVERAQRFDPEIAGSRSISGCGMYMSEPALTCFDVCTQVGTAVETSNRNRIGARLWIACKAVVLRAGNPLLLIGLGAFRVRRDLGPFQHTPHFPLWGSIRPHRASPRTPT